MYKTLFGKYPYSRHAKDMSDKSDKKIILDVFRDIIYTDIDFNKNCIEKRNIEVSKQCRAIISGLLVKDFNKV